MCDKGILECQPDAMKLEYCMIISKEIQDRIIEGISRLIGEEVVFSNLKAGEYPTDRDSWNRNTIIICTKVPKSWDTEVVRFSLKELPGCCGVLVSYHTKVGGRYQGKGINTFLQQIKEDIAIDNNYSMLMATVTSENAVEIHVLTKAGWDLQNLVTNKRTSNKILLAVKSLGVNNE